MATEGRDRRRSFGSSGSRELTGLDPERDALRRTDLPAAGPWEAGPAIAGGAAGKPDLRSPSAPPA